MTTPSPERTPAQPGMETLRQRSATQASSATPVTLAPTHTPVIVRTPPPRTDSYFPPEPEEVGQAGPRGAYEKWMTPVREGPSTRGDMELLVQYLRTPPPSKATGAVAAPLQNQFHDLKVSGIMDFFYRDLQEAIFVSLQEDDLFLDAQDWHGKLLESEKKLLDSIKRFILHTAIYCARANDFAFPRYDADGNLEASRLDPVDSLEDYVDDFIALAGFLKDSCRHPKDDLPSLNTFVRERLLELDIVAKEGKRRPRRYFFRKNNQRTTHIYARRVCCCIMGLTDDYDHVPEFGLNDWKTEVIVFDDIERLLWKGFGIRFKPDKAELAALTGSIVELDVDFIESGPFKLVKTTRVQEHLTLDRAGQVRVYTSKALGSTAYMFQNHKVARLAGIARLGLEIARSHALLFLQAPTRYSHQRARHLHLDLERVVLTQQVQPFDFKTIFYDALKLGNIPRLEDFVLLRPRLAELQTEMNDWRPQTIGDLFKRGYRDPLTWYGFWFATFIGIVGICSLGVAIAQTTGQFLDGSSGG